MCDNGIIGYIITEIFIILILTYVIFRTIIAIIISIINSIKNILLRKSIISEQDKTNILCAFGILICIVTFIENIWLIVSCYNDLLNMR